MDKDRGLQEISRYLRQRQAQSKEWGESRTIISDLSIIGQKLSELDLTCVDFNNCKIIDADFWSCDLRGASFKGSLVDSVKFIECLVYDMELPEASQRVEQLECVS